ncbi:MAG TPA: DoxX family protein [Thermoanaerobaculia bacterium]|jgi:putative oxidoreductase
MNRDLGLLILRVSFGLLLAGHGLGKVQDLIAGKTDFADPIGIGPLPSLILAAFAEFLCAIAVVVGFKTRWAAIPPLVTMAVAVLIVHANDDFGTKELAVAYGCAFLALVFTDGGAYSVDAMLLRKRRRRP